MIETPLRHRKGSRMTHWRRVSGRRRRQQAYAAPKRLSTRRLARRRLPASTSPADRDPIVRAELTHMAQRADQRRRPPAVVLLAAAFGASVVLTVLLGLIPKSGNQLTAAMRDTYVLLSNVLNLINLSVLALAFVGQLMLDGQALLLASDTVAREKQSDTWELLLMTGRSAGQIVMSKWRAVLVYLFQRYRLLIALRALALLWLALTSARSSPIVYNRPGVLSVILVPLIVLGATLLDVLWATSLGVTASAAIRRGLAYPAALGLFVVGLLPFIVVYLAITGISYSLDLSFTTFSHAPLVMVAWPIDGAELLGLSLLREVEMHEWAVLFAFLAANLAAFVGLTAGLLALARRMADRPLLRAEKSSVT